MREEPEDPVAEERLEGLRRDLYRPGSTPQAVDRYLEEARATPAETPEALPAPPRRRPRRARAIVVLVAAAAIATAAGAVAAGLSGHGTPPSPTAIADRRGDRAGQILTPYGAIIPAPTAVPVSVDGEAAAGQRYRGRGDSRFPLDLDAAPPGDGRLVLAVTAADGGAVGWRVVDVDPRRTRPERTLAASRPVPRTGSPVLETVRYEREPPMILEISADTDVRWTVTTALLPPVSPALR